MKNNINIQFEDPGSEEYAQNYSMIAKQVSKKFIHFKSADQHDKYQAVIINFCRIQQ